MAAEIEIDKETLWKHYELIVKASSEYLKIILNLNIFYYGVTGAIISFKYAHATILVITLLLSAIMGLFFGVILLAFSYRNHIFLEREVSRCSHILFTSLSSEEWQEYNKLAESPELQGYSDWKKNEIIRKKLSLDGYIYFISTDPVTYGGIASGVLMLIIGCTCLALALGWISIG